MHNASVDANVLYGYSTVRMPSGQLYTVRTVLDTHILAETIPLFRF